MKRTAMQQQVQDLRCQLMEHLAAMGSRSATHFRQQPYRLVLSSVMEEMGDQVNDIIDEHDRRVRKQVLSVYSVEEATEILMAIE